MRVEPHSIGSVMHVMKRGARGLPIVQDNADKKNFMHSLLYLNDMHQDRNWRETLHRTLYPSWPQSWPKRKPLVALWAFTLMPNHFHLIIQEIEDGGTARFMQRLCGSMSMYMNKKHTEKGSIFQGAYKARVVTDDADLRWLASYVMVKNTLELYPGGLTKAVREFEQAWQWGSAYPFSSMGMYETEHGSSPLIDSTGNALAELFKSTEHFKRDSKTMLEKYMTQGLSDEHKTLALE